MSAKKTTKVTDLIPNNFKEQPQLIEGKTRVFEDKVAAKVDGLELLGKFLTIFKYVLVLVVIMVLVLSRIFKGTTVAFSDLKPSYSRYLEMQNDTSLLNLRCSVTNDTLTYDAFTTYSYEKAEACEWVKADLEKSNPIKYAKYAGDYDQILRRDLLGNTSACKSLKKNNVCESIKDDCVRGHASVEQLLSNMKISNFPLKELLDSEAKLLTFVNSTLTQSLQSLLSGLEGPRVAVKQWASKNMPILYGFLGSMQSFVQGYVFRKSDATSDFYKRVQVACTIYNLHIAEEGNTCNIPSIGDGHCYEACNVPYCLYDGGDCLSGESIYEGSSNGQWKYTSQNGEEFFYQAFYALQQGDYDFENQYYNRSNADIYTEELITKLKTLQDENGETLFPDHYNHVFYGLSMSSIWHSLPNNFVGFDPNDTCGNPSTWYKSHELDRSQSWFSELQGYFEKTYEDLRKVYLQLGYPSGVSVPSGKIPVQSTDVYSCDALSQSHNLPGIVGFTSAQIKVWIDYTYAAFEFFKEKCGTGANPGEWGTDCPQVNIENELGDLISVNLPNAFLEERYDNVIDRLISELEYAYLGAAARENSGSVEQLLLDAGIKRDAKGYNLEAQVDYETYYKASEVSECTYSKKIGASAATIVTVVLGLIGGVTTSVSVLALLLYQLFRNSFFKKYEKESQKVQSKSDSSAVSV